MSTLTNLIAYWRMDESSGNRLDSVGSLRLDQSGTVGGATGKLGANCAQLGTVSVGLHSAGTFPADFSGNQLTIAGWYRIDSVSLSTERPIALIEVTDGASSYCGLRVKYDHATGYVFAETYDDIDNATHTASTFGALSTGTWYHLIATWDATTVTLYVNNTGDSYPGHVSMDSHHELSNMAFGNSAATYGFSVDEWGIWNEIISSTDRSDLYNSGTGAVPPGLGYPAGSGNQSAFFGFH